MADRADNADDRQPRLVVGARHAFPADRVFTRPVARRHRVVDHDCGHCLFAVGIGEEASANELQAHGFEIAWRHRLVIAVRVSSGTYGRPSILIDQSPICRANGRRDLQLRRQHVRRIEAEIDAIEPDQAANQQTGRECEDHRRCKLKDGQGATCELS